MPKEEHNRTLVKLTGMLYSLLKTCQQESYDFFEQLRNLRVHNAIIELLASYFSDEQLTTSKLVEVIQGLDREHFAMHRDLFSCDSNSKVAFDELQIKDVQKRLLIWYGQRRLKIPKNPLFPLKSATETHEITSYLGGALARLKDLEKSNNQYYLAKEFTKTHRRLNPGSNRIFSNEQISRLKSEIKELKITEESIEGKVVAHLIEAIYGYDYELDNDSRDGCNKEEVVHPSYDENFSENEAKNLNGLYLCIKRSPFDVAPEDDSIPREVIFTTLLIYSSSSVGTRFITYDYISATEKGCISGNVIRESQRAVFAKAVGDIKYELTLSIDNAKLSTSNIYINGSISTLNQIRKPYSTWLHMSKINLGTTRLEDKFEEVKKYQESRDNVKINDQPFLIFKEDIPKFLERYQSQSFKHYIYSMIKANYSDSDSDYIKMIESRILSKLCFHLDNADDAKRISSVSYIRKYI